MTTWKQHLPDYEFRLWNEENSPMNHPFVKAAYEAKKYAFVSDYVRFWALYNHGGVYLDTDMFVIKPFDELLVNKCFFGNEFSDKLTLSCGIIGCEQHNEFVQQILSYYESLSFIEKEIDNLVVPRIITSIYEYFLTKDLITILPFDFFYPFPYERRDELNHFMCYATTNTYAIHLWNLSWVSSWEQFKNRIVKRFKKYIR